MGFGIALAQNEAAMKQFESLSETEKQAVLERTHSVRSKFEMQMLVDSLCAPLFYSPGCGSHARIRRSNKTEGYHLVSLRFAFQE